VDVDRVTDGKPASLGLLRFRDRERIHMLHLLLARLRAGAAVPIRDPLLTWRAGRRGGRGANRRLCRGFSLCRGPDAPGVSAGACDLHRLSGQHVSDKGADLQEFLEAF
jgi:hypothetical protein